MGRSKKNAVSVEPAREAKAIARYTRFSARKGRFVADMIRGKRVDEAVSILTVSKRAAAQSILKTLKSAMANASDSKNLNVDDLYIRTIFVDEGPTLKRWLPRARGRADRINKRTCHTTVVLAERN